MEDTSDSFLSLFKHKSAIDPRQATSAEIDSDDEDESATPYQLGTGKKANKRKRTQAESSVKRTKSDISSDRTTHSKASKRQSSSLLPVTLDDERTTPTNGATNSPLPSYLAHALAQVNENKKLRALLKSSIDPDTDHDDNNHYTHPNNPPHKNSSSNHPQIHSRSTRTTNSTLLHPPTGHNSSTSSFSEKRGGPPPTVYSIDSDDDENAETSNQNTTCVSDNTNNSSNNNSNNNNISSTKTTNSNTTTSNSENSPSVLFFVYSSPNDQQPLKFRFLKTEAFTKLLNAYCKFKKFDGSSAGIKWYGLHLDPKQTPLHYEMSEEEKLYYYDKNGNSEHTSDQTNNGLASTTDNSSPAPHSHAYLPPHTNTAGHSDETVNNADADIPSNDVPQDVITLKLREGPNTQRFRIRITDPFKKLVVGYATKRNLDPAKITLLFDGLPLGADGTPETQDMESDDIIDVKIVK